MLRLSLGLKHRAVSRLERGMKAERGCCFERAVGGIVGVMRVVRGEEINEVGNMFRESRREDK